MKLEVTRILMTVRIQSQDEAAEAAAALEQQAGQLANVTYTAPTYTAPTEDGGVSQVADTGLLAEAPVAKVGRNEPCPCGSGKKYKNCHGRLA